MSIQTVGSSVRLIYQTKFPTFTADQLMKALLHRQYTSMQGTATDSRNPDVPPIIIPAFSKENVNILHNPSQNQLVIQILNTIELKKVIEDLKPILVALNMTENVMLLVSFQCQTSVWSDKDPIEKLTALVDSQFLGELSKSLGFDLKLGTMRITTGAPGRGGEREFFWVVIEPLLTNAKTQYFIDMNYQTADMNRFNEFINAFGEQRILSIVKQVNRDV